MSSLLVTGRCERAFENCHETLFKKPNKTNEKKPKQGKNAASAQLNNGQSEKTP